MKLELGGLNHIVHQFHKNVVGAMTSNMNYLPQSHLNGISLAFFYYKSWKADTLPFPDSIIWPGLSIKSLGMASRVCASLFPRSPASYNDLKCLGLNQPFCDHEKDRHMQRKVEQKEGRRLALDVIPELLYQPRLVPMIPA